MLLIADKIYSKFKTESSFKNRCEQNRSTRFKPGSCLIVASRIIAVVFSSNCSQIDLTSFGLICEISFLFPSLKQEIIYSIIAFFKAYRKILLSYKTSNLSIEGVKFFKILKVTLFITKLILVFFPSLFVSSLEI